MRSNSAGVSVSTSANSSTKAAVVALPKSVKNAGNVFVEASFKPENAEKVTYLTYFVKPKALNLSSQPIQVNTTLTLDGKEVGRATAVYSRDEINRLNKKENLRKGIR